MKQTVFFSEESRSKLKTGIDILADAVKVTLGPKGRNVVIRKEFGPPHTTKDGVTVAKAVELADPIENMGAQLIREVASKTGDDAGDGTTTSIVLAQSIINYGSSSLAMGYNPIGLKRGIDKAVQDAVRLIRGYTCQINDDFSKIKQIATISANNDEEIGELIASTLEKITKEGVITLENSQTSETHIKIVEGMQYDCGYISPYFINDSEKSECVLENPVILLANQKVGTLSDLMPLLNDVVNAKRPLLIIAEDVEGEILSTLLANLLRGQIKVCATRAQGFGEYRQDFLYDMAALVGGTVYGESTNLKEAKLDVLGSCDKVIVTKTNTTIINGHGEVEPRKAQLKFQLEQNNSDFNKQKLRERLAKLSGGVAVLYVGASSEVEVKEKKDRIEDALCATKAAIEEGIVPGGGIVYLWLSHELDDYNLEDADEIEGYNIIINALSTPIKQIIDNCGMDKEVILTKLEDFVKDDSILGYNAKTDQFENLTDAGVIDPAKVTRVALENAASIAGMYLLTDCVIDTISLN